MYTWSDLKLWLCCLLQRPLPHRSCKGCVPHHVTDRIARAAQRAPAGGPVARTQRRVGRPTRAGCSRAA